MINTIFSVLIVGCQAEPDIPLIYKYLRILYKKKTSVLLWIRFHNALRLFRILVTTIIKKIIDNSLFLFNQQKSEISR